MRCMPRKVPPVSMRPTVFPLGWITSPMKRSTSLINRAAKGFRQLGRTSPRSRRKSKSGKPQPNSRKNKRRNRRLGRLGSLPHAGAGVRQPIQYPSQPRRSGRNAGPSKLLTAARKALRRWTRAARPSSRLLPLLRGR